MATTQRSKLRQAVQRWKHKAIQRGNALKQRKKRLKELVASRNHWKRKAQTRQAQVVALQRENHHLRQRLNSPEKRPSSGLVDTPTAS